MFASFFLVLSVFFPYFTGIQMSRQVIAPSTDLKHRGSVANMKVAKVYSDKDHRRFLMHMLPLRNFVHRVANYFNSKLQSSLVEVYNIGSLAHGGFSQIYSDIDVGVMLNCLNPPSDVDRMISEAKGLDDEYGQKLSVFWGNPECSWGRLPMLDRLDLLDHGVPVLHNRRANFRRPTKDEVRQELRQSIERSWKPKIGELSQLRKLEPQDRKPYIRAILYPARLIYSWDNFAVDSNDRAVEYLRETKPSGLDLKPIESALDCRYERCSAEDVFALKVDLNKQFEKTMSYISARVAA
jgi:predicted nucleotidyltransferase